MRRRVFWSIVAVAAVAVVVAGLIGAVLGQLFVTRESRSDMVRQAEAARVVIAEQVDRSDGTGLLERLATLRQLPASDALRQLTSVITTTRRLLGNERFDVVVVTRAGEVTSLSTRRRDPYGLDADVLIAGRDQFVTAEADGERLIVYAATLVEDPPTGTAPRLAVVVPRPVPRLDVGALGRGILITLVLVLLLAAVAAGVVSRSLGRRLDALSHAARTLASGDRTVRAPEDGPDEFAAVGTAFNEMVDELHAARAREQEFLVSVGHDLRTPLTTIAGYAEMLEEGGVAAEESARIAAVLGFETVRLRRLVEDLMLLAHLEADEFTLHPEPVDVAAHLAELAEGFLPRALAARVRLEVDTSPTGPVVADADRLAQVAANLLENALRYTPEAGTVRLATRRDGPTVVVEVADSGSGIDATDLPHVFGRFYVARRYRRIRPEGSGLGLAIVKQLVDAMGADIEVSSSERGTTFTVRFPGGPAVPRR